MHSDDDLNRMLRDSDPIGKRGLVALADPDHPAARRVLAQARRLRRRRVRRIALVPVVAVALAGATAATQAWIAGDGEGHALDTTAVDCVQPEGSSTHIGFDIRSETPIEACQRMWPEMFGEPAPSPLVACVDSSIQGSIKVYRGGPEECARHRADPYAGPTDEQLRFAEFRAALEARFAGETCVPYPDLQAAIMELLAEHDLTGWVTEDYWNLDGPVPPVSAQPCVGVSFYDEPDRTVVIGVHTAGDPIDWP
jgi:hypothetical protein